MVKQSKCIKACKLSRKKCGPCSGNMKIFGSGIKAKQVHGGGLLNRIGKPITLRAPIHIGKDFENPKTIRANGLFGDALKQGFTGAFPFAPRIGGAFAHTFGHGIKAKQIHGDGLLDWLF